MKDTETPLFIAKITDIRHRGVSYEDCLYPNPDSNPDRTEVYFDSSCTKSTFIKALYSTEEGSNFTHYSNNTLVDIGGSRLNLEVGEEIKIYSDFKISN